MIVSVSTPRYSNQQHLGVAPPGCVVRRGSGLRGSRRLETGLRDLPYPASFRPFSAYEAGARSLRLFEHVLVPGLLQTAGYARAALSTGPHTSADEIEELVTARLARQALPRAASRDNSQCRERGAGPRPSLR
jgi:hypothetical protein